MSLDPTLLSDVENLVLNAGSMTGDEFESAFESMVTEWVGASDIDTNSRGIYFNGRTWTTQSGDKNHRQNNSKIYERGYILRDQSYNNIETI